MAEAATGGATGIGGLAQVDTGGMTTTEHGWVRFPDQAGHADAAGSGGDDGRGSCWGRMVRGPLYLLGQARSAGGGAVVVQFGAGRWASGASAGFRHS